jgi:hypothetical protein
MNLSYQHLLPESFHDDSRVWIYQSDRQFNMQEALDIEEMINAFVDSWQSHGDRIQGFGSMFFGRFIILMADESATGVSGCSTDSSVRLIREIERKFQVNMFNRQLLAFVNKEKIELLPLSQFNYAAENGLIKGETLYFNNIVLTKQDLLNDWIIPAEKSWLKTRFPQTSGS